MPPTIAHYNGTLIWHPTSTPPKLAVTLPPNHRTLQWHPTKAPSNGTTSSAPCNGTLVPRPIRQSGSLPSPLIGSKNPYSYRYLGKKIITSDDMTLHPLQKQASAVRPSKTRCLMLVGPTKRVLKHTKLVGILSCSSCGVSCSLWVAALIPGILDDLMRR